MNQFRRSHHRSAGAAHDTWWDFFRVLLVCLAGLGISMPADAAVVLADDEAVKAPAGIPRAAALDANRPALSVADDEDLQGGSDDDDFRPSPDRTCGPGGRAAPLSPLSVRCRHTAGCPVPDPAGASAHVRADDARARLSAGVCPALDTVVQVLR